MPVATRVPKAKPDIRAITRLVPPDGNLVQGQSDLQIDPALAKAAADVIARNQNHYCPAEGILSLREAIAEKVTGFNHVQVSAEAQPLEVLVTHGGTGALVAIAKTYLAGHATLLFEPYYPYHRIITEQLGGKAELFPLSAPSLSIDFDALRETCRRLKSRSEFPLRAIVVCSPANPTGKIFTRQELEAVAGICHEFDLLCISDEVYEHYVVGAEPHISMASLPGMWERTITVNSFSKSWNVSGWRLGYVYGTGKLVAPLNQVSNVLYVNSATPLQHALASVLPASNGRYPYLQKLFTEKRERVSGVLTELGFDVFESGSAFYLWARIPEPHRDAIPFNQMLMETAGVAGVPGAAFADSDNWDNWMRFCIAREEHILDSSLEKLRKAIG
ncbi:MAG TPA: pyridoxal phosphate-dependent aminotransferase [Clostridia bacterium]|nr:pyridoxal phosphate-dependent aminotransferase [Clostridia bacterium]